MTHNFACEKRRTRITRTHARERKRKGACANFRVATTRRNLDQNIPIWGFEMFGNCTGVAESARIWTMFSVKCSKVSPAKIFLRTRTLCFC